MSLPLEPLAAPQTLAAHTRRAVLAAIADGRLEPGGRYSVAQLAALDRGDGERFHELIVRRAGRRYPVVTGVV